MRLSFRERPFHQGLLIAVVAAISIGVGLDLSSPPRFDGAGYSVLALSLLSGKGYHEIDRPESPRHAHFPPGYPAFLALLWSVTGKSAPAAHALSAGCTLAAVVLAWRWLRRVETSRVAFLCGLSLAVNWTWARNGGSIQSEPVFLLLTQLAVLATLAVRQGATRMSAVGLGLLFGACILTRHVGIAFVAALGLDLILNRQTRTAMIAGLTAFGIVLPWVVWLALVRENTQVGLLAEGSLSIRVATLSLFYLQRIPDQLTGPFVEVATVFQRSRGLALAFNLWAAVATSVVVLGWLTCLWRPRKRVAGLVPFANLALLLVWPFTEAGRFLIPLIPFLIVGATEGLGRLLQILPRLTPKTAKQWAALAVLAASTPYSLYGLVADRSKAQRDTHASFDLACDWIANHATRPGPVVCRHPGELFWATGRQAFAIQEGENVADLYKKYKVSYILIDEIRYANATPNPLTAFVNDHPDRVREVWERETSGGASMAIYEVVDDYLTGPSNLSLP